MKQQKERNMKFKQLMTAVALLGAMSFGASSASANTGAAAAFDAHYVKNSSCTLCHTGLPGTRLALGNAWLANGGTKNAGPTTQAQWDALDVNADIVAGGYVVDPAWTLPTTTTTSSGGGGGCITDAATTPLMMVLAMLTLGFFVRRKKD